MARKSSRRRFLLGGAARDAVEDLLDAGLPTEEQLAARESKRPTGYLLEVGRKAMACEFHVYLNAGQHEQGADHAVTALDLVDELEAQLSVYREGSELSQINRSAFAQPTVVERRLYQLLKQAVALWQATAGAFDITAGPISKVWGFYRRAGRVPGDEEIAAVLERVGSQHVIFDDAEQAIQFAREGMEFNLGGIGKGYALDRCVEGLTGQGIDNFLIHGGQSSIVGRGSRLGLDEGERGWSVALRHPLKDDVRLGEIWLRDRALGTSGSAHQFFHHQGQRYSHILDPRTARPAEGLLSTTVLAPTGALADALATAFFVMGVEATRAYCSEHPEISALLVLSGKKSGSLGIHTMNVDDTTWRLYR